MATLNDPQKLFIVQQLAQYKSPTEVADAIKAELGVEVPPQQVECYDPAKHAGRKLSKKWRAVFAECRQAYLTDVSTVPLAHRGYRLKELQRLYERAKDANVPLKTQLIVEAEKITGDMYTNTRKHQVAGEGGGPLEVVVRRVIVKPE